MLDTLRANSRSVLTYVIFGIIILVFVVSFGPGAKGCSAADVRTTGYAAKVNGVSITSADFDRAYREAVSRGANPNDPSIRAQILKNLVSRELVFQEALQQGVQVSDEDLSREIQQMPSFQIDGKFDVDVYTRRSAENYGSRGQYETMLRHDLTISKMVELVSGVIQVPEDEIKQSWTNQNDQVNLDFVRFSSAPEPSKVTDAEVKAFQAANGERIDKFYKENQARFNKPRQIKARHILLKVERNASASAGEEAHKRILDIADKIAKGGDFAKLASEYTEDTGSKDRGGELPPFSSGMMVKEFEKAAFETKPGTVSAPVRTAFGWHLIKVDEVIEASNKTLEQARPEIAKDLIAEDTSKKSALDQANQALAKLKAGTALEKLFPADDPKKPAPITAPRVLETGLFNRENDWIPNAGTVPGLAADAFQHNAGEVLPAPYTTPAGVLIAVVKDRKRPDASQFAAKRSELTERMRRGKSMQIENSWIASLRKKAKVVENSAYVQTGPASSADVD
jgi:peptidyl-prolyl cis-trans isomerase D